MTIKFECEEIDINIEELGCTLMFSDKKDNKIEKIDNLTLDEIEAQQGQYLMLQRSFAEDDDEDDYYYIESNNEDINGEFEDFSIYLSRRKFMLTIREYKLEIYFNANKAKFEELKDVLKVIVDGKGEFTIDE